MAIAFKSAVQNAQALHDTVASYTLPALNTAVDDVILVGCGGTPPSSISDTIGNTYTKIADYTPGSGWRLSIWAAKSTGSNASNVVTINNGNVNSWAAAAQYTGVGSVGSAVTTATGAANATSVTSGSFSGTLNNLAFAVYGDGSNATEFTQGANYTERGDAAGNEWGGIEDRVGIPAGAQTASVSKPAGAEALSILVAELPVSGTSHTVSGTLASETFTLAGKPQRDIFVASMLSALNHTLAGPLNKDSYLVGVLQGLTFGLDGRLTRPDLLLEQAGRTFDFAIFATPAAPEVTPAPVVHVWGLRVDRDGRVVDPNMFYIGQQVGNLPVAPTVGPRSHNIVSVYDPAVLRYVLQAAPLRDVSVNTKDLDGILRALGFTPGGDGAAVSFKPVSGLVPVRVSLAGAPSISLATAPPANGTTPWAPAAGDPNWTNVMTDHGAVGDGVTDDRPAFAAAAATGKKIYVPKPAVYYRFATGSARIDLTNDMYGDGQMPEIRKFSSGASSSQTFRVINVFRTSDNPLIIQGLHIDGERTGTDSYNSGEWGHAIFIAKANWVEVRYCNLRNHQGDEVCVGGDINQGGAANPNRCFDIKVHNNTMYNAFRCGVAGLNVDRLHIHHNNITKLSDFVTAIDMEPNPTYSGDTNAQCWNVLIEDNTFTSERQGAVMLYHSADGYPPDGLAGGDVIVRRNSGSVLWGFNQIGNWVRVEVSGNTWV